MHPQFHTRRLRSHGDGPRNRARGAHDEGDKHHGSTCPMLPKRPGRRLLQRSILELEPAAIRCCIASSSAWVIVLGSAWGRLADRAGSRTSPSASAEPRSGAAPGIGAAGVDIAGSDMASTVWRGLHAGGKIIDNQIMKGDERGGEGGESDRARAVLAEFPSCRGVCVALWPRVRRCWALRTAQEGSFLSTSNGALLR